MPNNPKTRDIGKPPPASEITPERVYLRRRDFLGLTAASAAGGLLSSAWAGDARAQGRELKPLSYKSAQPGPHGFHTDEKLTPYEDAKRYNNFYEFGTGKGDPARHAANFPQRPWSIEIAGEAEVRGSFAFEDLVKPHALQERIYRLRCVEAWSMVIPWIGIPLADLIKRFRPTSKARYVRFVTLLDRDQMPGQRSRFGSIPWPYVEGLTMAEAMHPLTLLATGMYGREMPGQNGPMMRLVVPWKYGFKSIKSIAAIEFTKRQPRTTWEKQAPNEYGFYANVNPQVDHPRWSQATERRLPSGLFRANRIATRMFNGYAEQVADLYRGVDLRRFF